MSIKLSFECPVKHLDEYAPHMDYDFALAHLVMESDEYREYYLKQSKKRLVILDNSMFELGHPLSSKEIADCAKQINAHEVVAPDYLNVEQTVNAVQELKIELDKQQIKADVLGVCQGQSFEEWIHCHRQLIHTFCKEDLYLF